MTLLKPRLPNGHEAEPWSPRASDRRVCIRILKRLQGFSAMTETYHKAHPLDRAAMVAMRSTITAHLGPNGRAAFDELRGGESLRSNQHGVRRWPGCVTNIAWPLIFGRNCGV